MFLIAALSESRLGHTLLLPDTQVHSSGLIETSLVCGVASSVQSPSIWLSVDSETYNSMLQRRRCNLEELNEMHCNFASNRL